jgi:hypothetical protein
MPAETPLDEKESSQHLDAGLDAGKLEDEHEVVLKSDFDSLSYWNTIKAFKLVAFYCFIAAFSAATDGYQVSSSPPMRTAILGPGN